MSEAEYIEVLWRIITALCVVIAALVGVGWKHFMTDRTTRKELNETRLDLQKCKDRLGINGR